MAAQYADNVWNNLRECQNAGNLAYKNVVHESMVAQAYIRDTRACVILATTMYKISVSVDIDADRQKVWDYLIDLENWWAKSNPEHESLEILSPEHKLGKGSRLRVKEKIAGVPGVAEGDIVEWEQGSKVTWSADARYRLPGLTKQVKEGVTWWMQGDGDTTKLGADVWASFPGASGPFVEWFFKHVLSGVERDREHALTELRYIKANLEK